MEENFNCKKIDGLENLVLFLLLLWNNLTGMPLNYAGETQNPGRMYFTSDRQELC